MEPRPKVKFNWEDLERAELHTHYTLKKARAEYPGGFTQQEFADKYRKPYSWAHGRISRLMKDGVIRMVHKTSYHIQNRDGRWSAVRLHIYEVNKEKV